MVVYDEDKLRSLEGTFYLIPYESGLYALGQVARGGDLAIFKMLTDDALIIPEPLPDILFRVHYTASSVRKFKWIAIGHRPLAGRLAEPSEYRYDEIGTNQCFKMVDGSDDQEVPCDTVAHLEKLASWDNSHIIERVRDWVNKS